MSSFSTFSFLQGRIAPRASADRTVNALVMTNNRFITLLDHQTEYLVRPNRRVSDVSRCFTNLD